MENKKSTYTVCALIGICFLLTGSEYITWWLYKLPTVFESTTVDILSEGIGYLFQAVGIFVYALMIRKKPLVFLSKLSFSIIIILDGLATALAFLSVNASTVLIFGFLMNLLHGVIGTIYLTRLAQFVPQQRRGIVFGLSYAFGSIGTWVFSLLFKGTFLGTPFIFIVYIILIIAAILINRTLISTSLSVNMDQTGSTNFKKPILLFAALVVVALSIVKGLGFYFPSSDHLSGSISAVSMRAFYAVGLIAAGLINDRNRKYGAICCLASLAFPFITFGLNGESSISTVLWLVGYIFFGFFSVYRVVTFTDLSGKSDKLLYIAGFGLMFGRVGDSIGTLVGVLFKPQFVILLLMAAVLFVLTIFLFFKYYNGAYYSVLPQEKNMEILLLDFCSQYALSSREADVLKLIINGRSNSEIASDLYIAESTVKFHVKNILRKTTCTNRTSLTAKFTNL